MGWIIARPASFPPAQNPVPVALDSRTTPLHFGSHDLRGSNIAVDRVRQQPAEWKSGLSEATNIQRAHALQCSRKRMKAAAIHLRGAVVYACLTSV
jgi:hypothetical protein